MLQKTSRSKHANKRTPEQIERDRAIAIEMYNKGYTQHEIAAYISDISDYSISNRQVSEDIKKVRERWLETQQDEYRVLVRQELSRLEAFENEAWRAWRESKGTVTQKRVEEVAKKVRDEYDGEVDDEELVRLMVDKVVTTTSESVGDRSFLELIFKTQQERRKLLGVYAPARLDIDLRETLNIKGYSGGVSPSDWPDHEQHIVEGEFRDAGS